MNPKTDDSMNPYASPRETPPDAMIEKSSSHQRYSLPLSELVAFVAVISFLFAILVPAINSARELRGVPLVCAFLAPLYSPHPCLFVLFFPILSTSVFTCLLLGLRATLPERIRSHLRGSVPRTTNPHNRSARRTRDPQPLPLFSVLPPPHF